MTDHTPQGYAYVAFATCGCCICGAVADDPGFQTQASRTVSAWIREGRPVQRVPNARVRELKWHRGKGGCAAGVSTAVPIPPPEDPQLDLFEGLL